MFLKIHLTRSDPIVFSSETEYNVIDRTDHLLGVEIAPSTSIASRKEISDYDVSAFDGSKRMILSTTSLLGGKNPFLGIAYIVVGCVCLLLGIALLFIHIKCGKSTSEMIHVNPRTPYQ